MKRSALGIVAMLAVFGMMGCMDDIPMVCMEGMIPGMPDICEFMDQECNMAIPPATVCELLQIPEEECEDLFGGGWDLGAGTCQDLQDVGYPCAEDADCLEGLVCTDDACAA